MREVVDILIAEGSDVDESSEDEEGTDEDSEDISCKLFTLITDLIQVVISKSYNIAQWDVSRTRQYLTTARASPFKPGIGTRNYKKKQLSISAYNPPPPLAYTKRERGGSHWQYRVVHVVGLYNFACTWFKPAIAL